MKYKCYFNQQMVLSHAYYQGSETFSLTVRKCLLITFLCFYVDFGLDYQLLLFNN